MKRPGLQISDQEREWLQGQMDLWRGEGIVTDEQAQQVLGLYESREVVVQRKRSRFFFALMGIAALLVGMSALLLIGYNWQAIPSAVKLIIIFAVIGATHGVGFYLRYGLQKRTASEVVFFLGCLLYGAGIWLVAQVFHVGGESATADGMIWWALGVLPFALCLDTLLLHALLVGLLVIWSGTEVLGSREVGDWLFLRWEAIPNGAYALPLLALPGLAWAYRHASHWTVSLYVLVLAWWAFLQVLALGSGGETALYFTGALGGLLLLVAESHRPGSPFAIPYRFYGAALVAIVLSILSFESFYGEFAELFSEAGMIATVSIGVFAWLTVSLTVAAERRRAGERTPADVRVRDLLRRQALPLVIVMMMILYLLLHASFGPLNAVMLVLAVIANAAMLGFAVWLMQIGLREDRGRTFAAGVLYFLLWAVQRYFDLFGDVGGMLGAAAIFFLCGAGLFAMAIYWRRRSEVSHA